MRTGTLVVAAVATAALAGCGGNKSAGSGATATRTVERTRVELVTTPAGAATAEPKTFDAHAIFERDAPGVVTVLSLTTSNGSSGAEGSGFVLNGNGEIATNAHVVTTGTGSAIKKVDQVYIRFQDGNQVSASIVGFDPNADVALLKVDPSGLTLRPLQLGTNADALVGAPVAAIGSPFGEEQSLSVGIVSAVNRTIDSLTKFSISDAIQTDAAINHGNSGGPLVDAEGRVLGINSQIRSDSGDGSGVGFAVPVNLVKRSIDDLRADGKVEYAYVGVSTTPLYPQLAERLKLPVKSGVIVAEVVKGGPADHAGLRAGTHTIRFQSQEVPADADVITALDGHPVSRSEDLSNLLNGYKPGQSVPLRIIRDGKRQTITVKLGERPASGNP